MNYPLKRNQKLFIVPPVVRFSNYFLVKVWFITHLNNNTEKINQWTRRMRTENFQREKYPFSFFFIFLLRYSVNTRENTSKNQSIDISLIIRMFLTTNS